VDGRDQYREDQISLLIDAEEHEALNAWAAATLHRGHQQPQHATFPSDDQDYKVHDTRGHEIKTIQNGMDVFVSMR
jgi:hypothetical protein